jgi:hypothetical protein
METPENRMGRAAERRGYVLNKSPRDPRPTGHPPRSDAGEEEVRNQQL